MNKLILGDNLEILRRMDSESVDLVYLDPPFFSNRHYECIWGDRGEVRSFEDRWAGGIEHYIQWLKERVQEMHRVLKPTGSIYLHCDWHANAYIRVYILDPVFGSKNFRNEIVWCYSGGGASKKQFAKKHDSVFWYSKSEDWVFNADDVRVPYKWTDGQKRADGSGRDLAKGKLADDFILPDFFEEHSVMPWAKERIGYPTQKPEALLERIIRASSNEGDIVLDPFVGGGTTVAVANRLNRNWIGIDQSAQAIRVSENRINNHSLGREFEVVLHKYDYDDLFTMDPFRFESFIVQQFGGIPNIKQRGDLGLDGRTSDGTPIQVKQSESIGRNVVDNLKSAAERYDRTRYQAAIENGKPVAYLIAFSFGKGAIAEVARLRLENHIDIRLVRVDDIVNLAKKPVMSLRMENTELPDGRTQIDFEIVASPDSRISFYSWDWDYEPETKIFKPEVQIDTKGQQRRIFAPGTYTIAVKAVDEDGLETIGVKVLEIGAHLTPETEDLIIGNSEEEPERKDGS